MKKALLAVLVLAICPAFVQAKDPPNPANFSGSWALDFGQTKNPPAGLQAYTMVVNQDQKQLKVKTSLQGDLQPTQDESNSGGYPGGSAGGNPGRRGGGIGRGMGIPGGIGIGMPGGGMGMPGGRGGRPRGEGPSRGNIPAYKLYPQNAVYRLDGGDSTAQLGDPEQTDATSKAEWAKNGEALRLSLVGNRNGGQRGGKIQITDQWKFSKDRQYLMVDRNIHSPEGSGTIHLVFFKSDVGSTNGAAHSSKD
jgi:hypothetical protein